MRDNRGVWYIVASASGFSTLSILIKYAFAGGANICTIVAGRFLMAAFLLFIVLKLRRCTVLVPLPILAKLYLMGAVGYGGMSLLFASGVRSLPASLCGMLLYTYPALVSILSLLLRDERFSLRKMIALTICSAGLMLVLGGTFGRAPLPGVLFILGSAVVYSCYIVLGNRMLKQIDPLVTSFYVCVSAGLSFLIFGMATDRMIWHLPGQGWLAIAGIAIFPTLFGILGFFAGMQHIGATNASIISTLEPLMTVLLSALLLGERMTLLQIAGGAVLLLGVVILQWWDRGERQMTVTEV